MYVAALLGSKREADGCWTLGAPVDDPSTEVLRYKMVNENGRPLGSTARPCLACYECRCQRPETAAVIRVTPECDKSRYGLSANEEGRALARKLAAGYGGWLTAEYARHAPQRLSTVVIIAPGATVLRLRAQFVIRLALAAIVPGWYLRPLARWMFADQVQKNPEWLDPWLDLMRLSMRGLDRRLPLPPVWTDAEWGALNVPTLFLVGEHETIYDAGKAARRLNRVAPQVTTEIIPGAGHDLTIAQAEIVNRRIVEFLKHKTAAPQKCETRVG
jgi:hypothetical protein